jgi:hypothetical protein
MGVKLRNRSGLFWLVWNLYRSFVGKWPCIELQKTNFSISHQPWLGACCHQDMLSVGLNESQGRTGARRIVGIVAELFDPARGLRFSTYATIWIKGILGKSNLVETIKLPLRKWNQPSNWCLHT